MSSRVAVFPFGPREPANSSPRLVASGKWIWRLRRAPPCSSSATTPAKRSSPSTLMSTGNTTISNSQNDAIDISELPTPARPPQLHRLRIQEPQDSSSSQDEHTRESTPGNGDTLNSRRLSHLLHKLRQKDGQDEDEGWSFKLPTSLRWIPDNFDWAHFKPVFRCAVSAWISLVFMVIPSVIQTMGQASFLILIAAFLSPPSDPFIAVFERELILLFFVTLAYAWSCLGIKLASLARRHFDPSASINDIFSGHFIEAAPTVICAVFLFVGVFFLLYIKARKGPGPFFPATALACVSLNISFTVAPLYPYANYVVGQAIVRPIAYHCAISMLCSVLIFPETINAQFTKRLTGVLIPLSKAINHQTELLSQSAVAPEFSPKIFIELVEKAEAALVPLAASARLMKRDFSWGRFGATDINKLHEYVRRLTVRAHGMAYYYRIIDPTRDRFPATPALSQPGTPRGTSPSRSSPTPAMSIDMDDSGHETPVDTTSRRDWTHHSHHRNSFLGQIFPRNYHHFFHDLRGHRNTQADVGIFEMQRYLNLETRFDHPRGDYYVETAVKLLGESTQDLLAGSAKAIDKLVQWLNQVNSHQWRRNTKEREASWNETLQTMEKARLELEDVLKEFRVKKRHRVLDMYRSALDEKNPELLLPEELPPHRYLFQCFVYQYHLIQFAILLDDMFSEIIALEKDRKSYRIWPPVLPLAQVFSWDKWEITDSFANEEDEDPNVIMGIDPEKGGKLGEAQRRDPDALAPGNIIESIGSACYRLLSAIRRGNVVFAIKAGILTILLSLPSFLPSTAKFAYTNKFIWEIFMGQLTLSRFRGDTTFGLSARIISTFFGGLIGTAMWYISAGSGDGNPYGLAAVAAVFFPLFFYGRLYWPVPPLTNVILFVTTILVIGYSWQDTHLPTFSNPGHGLHVAWIRFVLVTVGVTAAFLFSYLPPSTTLRRYIRMTHSTTIAEIGQLYCDIISYAHAKTPPEIDDIPKKLIAIRLKLKRTIAMKANVVYEGSLRGKWPAERYQQLFDLQMEIAYLLSHLRSTVEHLEPAWRKAFLRRTRFLESNFQGDVLAVLNMISTSLTLGTPLPQVTPCPLLDRFMHHQPGLHILRPESEDDLGLPRSLSVATLMNEQYLFFSVGVATAHGIVLRLDRLMLATKELVGEQYHIHGLDVHHRSATLDASERRHHRR